MAIIIRRLYSDIEMFPDNLVLPVSIELPRNGVTANESLPKNISHKCNKTATRGVPVSPGSN